MMGRFTLPGWEGFKKKDLMFSMSWYVEMQVWVLGGSHFLEQNQKVRVRYMYAFLPMVLKS
jgi:TRAP-type mannitol/chloroaromatic compound transport system permease small subunit